MALLGVRAADAMVICWTQRTDGSMLWMMCTRVASVSTFESAYGDLFLAKMSAAATAAVLPVLIAGWVAQRHLVTGLTMGAVK
jgi:sorbitol/mannitol transport system permease protein